MKQNKLLKIIVFLSIILLLTSCVSNIKTQNKQLGNAAFWGKTGEVKQLLQNGADVNASNYGFIALHWAAYGGKLETVKILLENGSNVDARDTDAGNTPLLFTVGPDGGDYPKTVKLLLENGANINAKNYNGDTPLLLATNWDYPETAKVLLENGANIDVVDKDGDTPLHKACKKKEIEIVELLLKKGADLDAVNNAGKTPLDYYNPDCFKDLIIDLRQGKNANIKTNNTINIQLSHNTESYKNLDFSKMSIEDLLDEQPLVNKTQILALSDALFESEINKLPHYLLQPDANPAKLKSAIKKRMHDAQMAIKKYNDIAQELKKAGKNDEAQKYRDISIAITGYQDSLVSIMNELNKY